jgi:hypothetical protein
MDTISGGFKIPSWFELGYLSVRLHLAAPEYFTRDATTGRVFARWVDPAGGARWAIPTADLPAWPAGWPPDAFASAPAVAPASGLPGAEGFGAKNQGMGAAESFLGDLVDSAGDVASKVARGAGAALGAVAGAAGKAAGGASAGFFGTLVASPYAALGALVLVGVAVLALRRR